MMQVEGDGINKVEWYAGAGSGAEDEEWLHKYTELSYSIFMVKAKCV